MESATSRIVKRYQAQGYELPDGLSIEDVERGQKRYRMSPMIVPVAVASGAMAWGVPLINGQFLTYDI